MTPEILCDIIVPVWNQESLTRRCLTALREKTRTPHRLILVDNGSGEETRRYLESLAGDPSFGGVLIRNSENLGYIRAINQGLQASRAPYVCLLNNDIVVTGGWLERMVEFAESRPDAGLLNPQQNHDPGQALPEDLEAFARAQAGSPGEWMELDHCTGGCLLIKRAVIEKIGGLDEAYGAGYWEDNDYSRRAKEAGFRSLRLLDTYVWHDVGASFRKTPDRKEKERRNRALYASRWGEPVRVLYPVHEGIDFRRARFQQIFQTAHALARQGCQVDLLLGRNAVDPLSQGLAHYGLWPHENLRIHSLPMLRPEGGRFLRVSWDGVFLWSSLIKIRGLLRDRDYDALYARHLNPAAFFLRFRRYLGVPVLFEAHEIFHRTTEKKGKAGKILGEESRVYPRVDGIVATTRSVAEELRGTFCVRAPLEVIPNGVNAAFFLPRREGRDPGKIVYIGQLYAWKGLSTLIEAVPHLKGGTVHIVGGSREQAEEIRLLAVRKGVEGRVVFHGQVSPARVLEHLSDAAVAVHPLTARFTDSLFSSPLKIFEYMAARVPLVASDLPSTREILADGVNALLTEPDNPASLARGIQRLLDDRGLAERLAERAREDARGYTWEKRAERIVRFIRSLKGKEG